MPPTRSVGASIRMAVDVPRWTWAFYRDHLALVVGISLIPSAQRAVAQFWGARLPAGASGALELVTAVARIVLLVMVFRLAVMADERLQQVDGQESVRRITAFARRHWRVLIVHGVLLAATFAMFDLLPDIAIAPQIPDDAQAVYWAVLLAIKNPTIIAFTMVWQIGVIRQMLLHVPDAPGAPHAPVAGRRTP